jgi:uncharacterized membrane protein YfcA
MMFDPLSWLDLLIVALAAVAGGAVNALAGGGTLITFPILTAVGIPAVAANITNTVALAPGYLSGTLAQKNDLKGQERRLVWLVPASVAGGLVGGLLLLNTEERIFGELVPYLILLACLLLALQGRVRAWLTRRAAAAGHTHLPDAVAVIPVFLASIYGGYFGAGLSVIVLAVLGLVIEESLTRLNALKQAIAFCVNVAAALFFVFSGQVVWTAAAVMAVGAIVGGILGGRLAGSVQPGTLRVVVITLGLIAAVIYFVR